MIDKVTRREVLARGTLAGAIAATGNAAREASAQGPATRPADAPNPISLNTATLRGHHLPLPDLVDIAAKAGYQGIEPWPDELDRFLSTGGKISDLDKRIRDHGLKVTGAVAFFEWMVDDDARRARGFEEARRRMEQLSALGGQHVAAPPAGDVEKVDLLKAAERYHDLLKLSESFGVVPAVELWGPAKNGYRMGQVVAIAIEARHPKACVLPDVFHLYKGGSGLACMRLVNPDLIAGMHLNDYPANPPRETIKDANRVYPGDGVAPLEQLFRDLNTIGYRGAMSVELFNPDYYKQDPAAVARTALQKTRAVMARAMNT